MLKALLAVSAIALAACCPGHGDDDPTTHGKSAYVTVPGVVECNGTVTSEFVGSHTWLPVLRCTEFSTTLQTIR